MYKERRAAANNGFAIAGVPCFADTLVQGGPPRKAPKRYRSV
jgi:hypothetical protein